MKASYIFSSQIEIYLRNECGLLGLSARAMVEGIHELPLTGADRSEMEMQIERDSAIKVIILY